MLNEHVVKSDSIHRSSGDQHCIKYLSYLSTLFSSLCNVKSHLEQIVASVL